MEEVQKNRINKNQINDFNFENKNLEKNVIIDNIENITPFYLFNTPHKYGLNNNFKKLSIKK
jgi:hypothetical protein